ncbi:hypothetical protein [Candidatus Laterigemmans baculatus]|uniref:hypothetical protein n=1 Tax=Candidatus Laterigemmans baculatus TaxID=2770505 RepID=UPI0013D9DBCF|nr:hypothetical protein [Candidatus Laterigemmans baculatus]
MDTQKRKMLEAAGWKVGDAADFLEMDEEERQLLDTRVELTSVVKAEDGNAGSGARGGRGGWFWKWKPRTDSPSVMAFPLLKSSQLAADSTGNLGRCAHALEKRLAPAT